MRNFKVHIFVVDDSPDMLDVVSLILKKTKFKCTCFTNADDCLQQLESYNCDLLITDVKMPGKDGMELLTEARRIVPWIPILVMSAYGVIPLAVKAIKTGAIDFIEKPLDPEKFVMVVESALKQPDGANFSRHKELTKTERIVLCLILQGKSNKGIAYILHRSIRTIEVHRSHIMHKIGAGNVVDLVKRTTAMDFEVPNE